MRSELKLGTRRSLLAWAQSQWVASELERIHPHIKVTLVGIETRGDKIQDIPLSQVDGKEFFVAELDSALRSGAVDLTVHSLKDLSLERSSEFVCGAIPRRENPRDVMVFCESCATDTPIKKPIKIGTSSPRRIVNIPPFLERAFPRAGGPEATAPNKFELVEIRGNVNTRLSRLHEPLGHPRHLDAVVLAFAGLIRLWRDEAARCQIEPLLKNVRWMILPITECPPAPGQGALAIECRSQDHELRDFLMAMHDPETSAHVEKERALLEKWGGGCHQEFGAVSINHKDLGNLFAVRGKKPGGTFVNTLEYPVAATQHLAGGIGTPRLLWDGLEWARCLPKPEILMDKPPNNFTTNFTTNDGGPVFIAHSRAAVTQEWLYKLRGAKIRNWTSGIASWFRLAEQGVWVEGCADSLGFRHIISTIEEPVLGLPPMSDWTILTHDDADEGWENSRILPTYRLNKAYPEAALRELRQATHIFWASGSQFLRLKEHVCPGAHHACGPGKTLQCLRQNNCTPAVFPSVKEWKKWSCED